VTGPTEKEVGPRWCIEFAHCSSTARAAAASALTRTAVKDDSITASSGCRRGPVEVAKDCLRLARRGPNLSHTVGNQAPRLSPGLALPDDLTVYSVLLLGAGDEFAEAKDLSR
jgi:hypothetical protein